MGVFVLIGAGLCIAAAMFALLGLPLLRASDDKGADSAGGALNLRAPRARFAAIVFLGFAPLIAMAAYLRVGSPPAAAPPAPAAVSADAIAALPEKDRQAMIEAMVDGLAARLDRQPDDAEGWRMLARSQLVLRRPAESAASYRRLLALEEGTLDDWRNFSTALAGVSPPDRFPTGEEFLRALDEIENRAPDDPLALFYRGGAASERGDDARAVALWSKLLSQIPADAPVRATLERLVADARANAAQNAVPE